jgi:hypothetical protein
MPEDVADDLRGPAVLDLSRCTRVAEEMSAKKRAADTSAIGIERQPMTDDRRAAKGAVRQTATDEDGARHGVRGPTALEVRRKRTRHRVKQRQLGHDACLRTPHADAMCPPVDVIQAQRHNLGRAHAVGRHQEEQRLVPKAKGCSDIDRSQDPTHVGPGHGTRRTIDRTNLRRDDERREIRRRDPSHLEVAEERAERAADPRHSLRLEPDRYRLHERVDVIDAD